MNQNNSQAGKTCGLWRRLLSVVLAVCMVISMTPAAFADDSLTPTAPAESVNEQTEPAPEVTAPAEDIPAETVPAEAQPEVTAPAETADPAEPITEAPAEVPAPLSPAAQLVSDMISALPPVVTEENSGELRAKLQEILDIYAQLDMAEQELVDVTPCILLQQQLGELDSAQTFVYGGKDEGSAVVVEVYTYNWNGGYFQAVFSDIKIEKPINVMGDVTLILNEDARLYATKGIVVNEGSSLTIKGTGYLEATGEAGYAGIGNGAGKSSGAIIIDGGTIVARGTDHAAGIGCEDKASTNITINGGKVNAYGGRNGPGIGSGDSGTAEITINGGDIYAAGNYTAAGIGGVSNDFSGNSGNFTIKITGGRIEAKGGDYSAGIGANGNGGTSTITIDDGYVTARGGKGCVGIGYNSTTITINGGEVRAFAEAGTGIGCSKDGTSHRTTVIINGGTVYANNGTDYGIGGSYSYVTINGGDIFAGNKIGIGGSYITINGGNINATGNKNAAIGCYDAYGRSAQITITGGNIIANSSSGWGIGDSPYRTGSTFNTGTDGKAVIKASSISDTSKQSEWQGIIYNGRSVVIGGNQTLSEDLTIDSGAALTVNENSVLTIPNGVTLTNNGTIAIKHGAAINNIDSITGTGIFTTQNLTEDMIVMPENLVYNGGDMSDTIINAITYVPVEISGRTYTPDVSNWNIAATPIDDLSYNVTFTYPETSDIITKKAVFSQSAAVLNDISISNGDNPTSVFNYGETITIKARPTATGEAPAEPLAASMFSLEAAAPTAGQMAVFYGEVQVSEAVYAGDDGLYTMTVLVTDLLGNGAQCDEEILLSLRFVGNNTLADTDSQISVTINRIQLTAAAEIRTKSYDGTADAVIKSITFTDPAGNPISLTKDDYTASAQYNDPEGGADKPVTVTVTLNDTANTKNYQLASETFVTSGNISYCWLDNNYIVAKIQGDNFMYVDGDTPIEPEVTVYLEYEDENGQPVAELIDPSQYTVTYKNNTRPGNAAVTVEGTGNNYHFNSFDTTFKIACPHSDVTGDRCNICYHTADVVLTAASEIEDPYCFAPVDFSSIMAKAVEHSTATGETVTIAVNETVDFSAESAAFPTVNNGAKINITVGKLYSAYTASLSGKIIIENGEVVVNANSPENSVGDYILTSDNAKLVLNGGKAGSISLNGCGNAVINNGSVGIMDVTSADEGSAVNANVTVTGGSFNAFNYHSNSLTANNIAISGGQFDSITVPEGMNVSQLLVEGYTFYDAENNIVDGTSVTTLTNVSVERAGSHIINGNLEFQDAKETVGDLEIDGYCWNPETHTLDLKDCVVNGYVTVPNSVNVTINLTGESVIRGLFDAVPKYGGYYEAYHVTFTGQGKLNIIGRMCSSSGEGSTLLIDAGTTVAVDNCINVLGNLTVKGSLTAKSANDPAIRMYTLTIDGGSLEVSGQKGVTFGGYYGQPIEEAVTIINNGSFTGNCTDYNIWLPTQNALSDEKAEAAFNFGGDSYIPGGYSIQWAKGEYQGYVTIAADGTPDSAIQSGTGLGGELHLERIPYRITFVNGDSSPYTGSPITPEIIVTSDFAPAPITDGYTVAYENNIIPGTAKVIVTITDGDRTWQLSKTFKITCSHIDADGNGLCETCCQPVAAKVEINGTASYYDDIQAAWADAVGKTASVTVLNSCVVETTLEIPAGTDITLNMLEGAELTGSVSLGQNPAINLNGILRLESGTISTKANYLALSISNDSDNKGIGELYMTGGNLAGGMIICGEYIIQLSGGTIGVIRTMSWQASCVIGELPIDGYTLRYVDSGEWLDDYDLSCSEVDYAVEVLPMPVRITGQSEDMVLEFNKDSAALSVTVTSLPEAAVTYQWYTVDENGAETAIEGAANPELVLNSDMAPGSYKYCCSATADGYVSKSRVITVDVKEKFTVITKSQLNSIEDSSVGALTGGGIYFDGTEITVTAPAVNGCAFDGWYDGDTKVCENLSYTFILTADIDLVAKYTSNQTVTVTINGLNGAKFYVNGNLTVQPSCTEHPAIGSKLKLTAAEPEKVSAWLNASNKIIGTGASIELTVTGDMTVELMYKANDENQAMVEFVSDYGQLLDYKSYTKDQTITPPVSPSKLGYTFMGWSVTGDTVQEWSETEKQIQDKISAGERHITVRPVYEATGNTFTVKVKYSVYTYDDEIYECAEGSGLTVVAKDYFEDRPFKCWMDENNNILSYETSYFLQVTRNITLKAEYAYSDEAVDEAKPVIRITSKYASVVNGKNKVSFSATRSVPKDYTLVEHGIIYTTAQDVANDDTAFALNGAKVYKMQSSDTSSNGIYTMNVNVGSYLDNLLYVRGYMIVRNEKTNNIETIYSVIDSGSYNGLNK